MVPYESGHCGLPDYYKLPSSCDTPRMGRVVVGIRGFGSRLSSGVDDIKKA